MVWIDTTSQLEYYSPNPQWGCYNEPVYAPNDILLQARYGTPLNFGVGVFYDINILAPDGSLLETLTTGDEHFDIFNGQYTIKGTTYNYTNLRCNNYTPKMLDNICFVIQLKIYDSNGVVYFNKYTQKYKLYNTSVGVSLVSISGATDEIVQCGGSVLPNPCNIPNVKFVAIFDCIDQFTGDYYGNSTVELAGAYNNTPFPFVKLSNLEATFRAIPKSTKTTISINNRVQRTETTDKYLLTGQTVFPEWKMQEIENMMLASNLFVDDVEYRSEGGTFFKQFGRPFNCLYMYQLSIEFIGRYRWQNFGCTPVCESQSWYYLIK